MATANGIYRGTVVDARDPDNNRRLKLKVPQLLGDQVTEWAWPREDASTKTQVPAVGQGVWVMFEGGDMAFPVWVGTFGKVYTSEKHGLIKPLSSSVSLTNASPYIVTVSRPDGTAEIDILASLVAMANKITNLETRLAAEESKPDNIGAM